MPDGNLYADLSTAEPSERFEELMARPGIRIERIVSNGHTSPTDPNQWYDQDTEEWVAVLRGNAHLAFEDDGQAVPLGPGDFVHIPAHRRHRVTWTDPVQPTIWLAVHFEV